MAISAQEMVNIRKREEWEDMLKEFTENPEQAANHLAFGMSLEQRQRARQIQGKQALPVWNKIQR